MPTREQTARTYYVGFTDGEPHSEVVFDDYGGARRVILYERLKDARERFQDVRRAHLSATAAAKARRR